jgi:hypothetical protein
MSHADAKNFIDYSRNGIAEVFFVDEALFDVLQVASFTSSRGCSKEASAMRKSK